MDNHRIKVPMFRTTYDEWMTGLAPMSPMYDDFDIWNLCPGQSPLAEPIDYYPDDFFLAETEDCMESRPKESVLRCQFCMWTGTCVSKLHPHPRLSPIKKDTRTKTTTGRSLLISRFGAQYSQSPAMSPCHQQQSQQQSQHQTQQQCRVSNLDSDGNSPRPDTPQSITSDTETEEEEEAPIFRHDQISVHEKLSEYISEAAAAIKVAPASEVTGQQVTRHYVRRKDDEETAQQTPTKWQSPTKTDIRNTLSDHCYHLNQPRNLEHLGIQTPSESGASANSVTEEEEIDVVTFEKPGRQGSLPSSHLNTSQQQQQQQQQQHVQTTTNAIADKTVVVRRPRGRPPSNANRKRNAQSHSYQRPAAKRAREQNCQRRGKTAARSASNRTVSSEDEMEETDKRSLHNNMERQRRIGLRNLFEELRLLVPAIAAKEKAPKVTILRQARLYCDKLTEMDQIANGRIDELKKRQEQLRTQLRQLRRNLALRR